MKDLKINKELMSAVLGHNDICNERIIQNKLLYMCKNDGMWDYEYEYNIYEFAFKCKEWAKNKEHIIHSSPTQKIEHTAIVQSFDINKFYYGQNQFYALTEVEAIIKACEWLLNEVDK